MWVLAGMPCLCLSGSKPVVNRDAPIGRLTPGEVRIHQPASPLRSGWRPHCWFLCFLSIFSGAKLSSGLGCPQPLSPLPLCTHLTPSPHILGANPCDWNTRGEVCLNPGDPFLQSPGVLRSPGVGLHLALSKTRQLHAQMFGC